jgi:hypothetical protein
MRTLAIATGIALVVGGLASFGLAQAQTINTSEYAQPAKTRTSASPSNTTQSSSGSYGTESEGIGRSGTPVSPTRDNEGDAYTHALNMLQADGYTGIQNFRRVGNGFETQVDHNRHREQVMVDPAAGTIRPVN